MKTATLSGNFLLKCLDHRLVESLILDKKKMIIGSTDRCDIQLKDKSVSSLHAFIMIHQDGFLIKDLFSESGLFLNGKRIQETSVYPGDRITIGTLSFEVELLPDQAPVFNPDQEIETLEVPSFVNLPEKEGFTFIDGEFCNITFDDSNYKPLTDIPKIDSIKDYVELDTTEVAVDIAHSIKGKRLEVINYVNSNIIDVSYIILKDGEYSLTSQKKSKFDITFHTINKVKVFSIKNNVLKFFPNDILSPSKDWSQISLDVPVFLTFGAEQVSFRLVDHTVKWSGLPAFYRDRDFLKQGSKIFATVFLPLLLLLFVSIPQDQDIKEELAVVYKLPEKMVKPAEDLEKSELKAEEIITKTENTGHKDTAQPNQKVDFAEASANKKVLAKATAPAPAAKTSEVAPVKAYEFKSSVAFNSLVGDAPKINAQGSSSKNALKDSTFNTGSSDTGALVAGADIGVSKFNGSDKKGNGSASYGSRGLASKSGFDSSYLEPKTVVLGSMDPELLRKILREYIPQFRHCYQKELIGHSDKIKGIIDLNFTISAAGKVSKYNIKVKDAQFSQKGIGCMGEVLSLIDFPKPKGGGLVDVRQPLNFFAETEKI